MREILFRGKSKNSNKWVYGWYCGKTLNHDMSDTEESSQIIDFKTLYWHTCRPETVGQFTGLTDKSGKKIFEGDIVKISHDAYHGVRGEVFFKSGSFMLKNVSDVLTLYGFLPWCEVIDNIHDNPELLEVE